MTKLRVGIIGVSGYGGGEIFRLALSHPDVDLTYVTSSTYVGQPVTAALPGAAGRSELVCEQYNLTDAVSQCDFVFLAGEAGFAMKAAPELVAAGIKVVDLSADFRLKDPAEFQRWYKMTHSSPESIVDAVYGMPEINREAIRTALLVANPGCYPTSAALALLPLLVQNAIDQTSIIVDSMSGVSGAGRSKFTLDYHFSEVNESARAYGVGGAHRHTPEIEQTLSTVTDSPVTITFTPHLVPITRGILTTAYATLTDSSANPLEILRAAYAEEPFVVVLGDGQFPATKHTFGTNNCIVGATVDRRTNRVIVVSAIDNLVKGAAGQAIQNMNIMCGFDETAGLTMTAVWP